MPTDFPPLRPDYLALQASHNDHRSVERLRAHYLLERELADRLRDAGPTDRAQVYNDVYHEMFRSLSDHPQTSGRLASREAHVRRLLARLKPLLGRDKHFLEIGCGDAALSAGIASHVARSYSLDVTDALIDRSTLPGNVQVLITNGIDIPLSQNSIDLAMSDQLMEHLHPADVPLQLAEIFRVLKPGGTYYCITPNRLTGPHDISCFFDYEATGFHIKEYDCSAIEHLFRAVGFRRVKFLVSVGRRAIPSPRLAQQFIDRALAAMPRRIRAWASRRRIVLALAGLNVIGVK